jgi:hypothetical protein
MPSLKVHCTILKTGGSHYIHCPKLVEGMKFNWCNLRTTVLQFCFFRGSHINVLDWLLNSKYVIFCDFKFQGAASAVGDKYRMVLTWVCKRGTVLGTGWKGICKCCISWRLAYALVALGEQMPMGCYCHASCVQNCRSMHVHAVKWQCLMSAPDWHNNTHLNIQWSFLMWALGLQVG